MPAWRHGMSYQESNRLSRQVFVRSKKLSPDLKPASLRRAATQLEKKISQKENRFKKLEAESLGIRLLRVSAEKREKLRTELIQLRLQLSTLRSLLKRKPAKR